MAGLLGLRVLDISSGIAGPFCARLLADGGADVIRIEAPEGCASAPGAVSVRGADRHGLSLDAFLNQNKRGVSLDIGCASGRDIFKRLAAVSDILVESFRPGTLAELGLGYSELGAVNPAITLVSITDFGQTGPYRHHKGDHLAVCARGWAFTFGDPGREPLHVGFPVMYYMAGMFGAVGALAALRGRRQDGKGQHVDISAQEVCLNMLNYPQVTEQFNCPSQTRDFSAAMGFYVKARGGWVTLNYLSAGQWENLCALVGAPHLAEDPAVLHDKAKRRAIMPELIAAAGAWAKDRTQAEAFYAAQELQVPAGMPYTPQEMLESDQLRARDFFIETCQAGLGRFVQPRDPFPSISLRSERKPAPDPGEHNQEVLGNIGFGPDDLRELRRAGVI